MFIHRFKSVFIGLCLSTVLFAYTDESMYFGADVYDPFYEFKTNFDKASIDINELVPGGPDKDDIPALYTPEFVSIGDAEAWLEEQEPVIAFYSGKEAKAYPLQILIWHEVVNDIVDDIPVVVTFCPLCYSAIVYERTTSTGVYTFGISGFLRNSNTVMYDNQTESLWQQITGEAIVGKLTGQILTPLPSQIISFEQFKNAFPEGVILSQNTGDDRIYGKNPYIGYDDTEKIPFLYDGPLDDRLPPMEKIIVIEYGRKAIAYPYSLTSKKIIINDTVGRIPIAIFHIDGAVSALDSENIQSSKPVGSTAVFDRRIDDYILTFKYTANEIIDIQTNSYWDITGIATNGLLRGKRLRPINHGDYFAFAWLAFRPDTKISH